MIDISGFMKSNITVKRDFKVVDILMKHVWIDGAFYSFEFPIITFGILYRILWMENHICNQQVISLMLYTQTVLKGHDLT